MNQIPAQQKPKHTLVIDAGDIFQGARDVQQYKVKSKSTCSIRSARHLYDPATMNLTRVHRLAKQLSLAKFAGLSRANLDCTKEPELGALVKPSIVKGDRRPENRFYRSGRSARFNALSLSAGGSAIKSADADWTQQ